MHTLGHSKLTEVTVIIIQGMLCNIAAGLFCQQTLPLAHQLAG